MKKRTKRQQKAQNGPNAMVMRSLRSGRLINLGGVIYRGSYELPWVRSSEQPYLKYQD